VNVVVCASVGAPYASILIAVVHFWIDENPSVPTASCFSLMYVGVELSHTLKDFHEQVLAHPISPSKIVVVVQHGMTHQPLSGASTSFFLASNLHGAASSSSPCCH
jgi:hypothetical protein